MLIMATLPSTLIHYL